eukprot:6188595-Pleurochrysis_carterae.AAC.1
MKRVDWPHRLIPESPKANDSCRIEPSFWDLTLASLVQRRAEASLACWKAEASLARRKAPRSEPS